MTKRWIGLFVGGAMLFAAPIFHSTEADAQVVRDHRGQPKLKPPPNQCLGYQCPRKTYHYRENVRDHRTKKGK